MAEDRYRSEPLGPQHDRSAFSCGVDTLDRYFKQQAGQDSRRHLSTLYVMVDTITEQIVGYYTLSSISIQPASLPPQELRRLPHYEEFPGILIGRLAIDRGYQGQGLGGALLVDALRRARNASDDVAAMAVVVDAIDDAARSFYERFGFRRLEDLPNRLLASMDTVTRLTS